jgi:hypothetical protein
VHSVHVYRPERLGAHLWTVLDGGMCKTECHSEIQGALTRKEPRLSRCLERWPSVLAPGRCLWERAVSIYRS